MGRLDEALSVEKRSVELDPTNSVSFEALGHAYYALRGPRQAEAALRRSIEMQPDLGTAHRALIFFYLEERRRREALDEARQSLDRIPGDAALTNAVALAEIVAGDRTRAREPLERILPELAGQRWPHLWGIATETSLAYVYLDEGRRKEAEKLLDQALDTDRRQLEAGNQQWGIPFDIACVHVLRGHTDEALRWLEKAVDAGWRGWPVERWHPILDPLRGDERFKKLMARIDSSVAEMRQKAGLR
jgi:tetratricopeptide (TPR) repeat protein